MGRALLVAGAMACGIGAALAARALLAGPGRPLSPDAWPEVPRKAPAQPA